MRLFERSLGLMFSHILSAWERLCQKQKYNAKLTKGGSQNARSRRI